MVYVHHTLRIQISMKYFVILLFGIVSLTIPLYPQESSACSCIIQSTNEALEDSVAVFSGKVTKITEEHPTSPMISSEDPVTVEIQVDRVWKGPSEKTIKVTTASDEGTCGYGFEMGKTYLVYSYEIQVDDPLVLKVSLCSRTAPIADASEDLSELGGPILDYAVLSPLKQTSQGIDPPHVICKEGLVLIIKYNGSPACVRLDTAVKLEERGWGVMPPPCCKEIESSTEELDLLRANLAKTPECVELSLIIEDASGWLEGKQREYDNSEVKDPKLASAIEQEQQRLANAQDDFDAKCYPQLNTMDNYELPYDPDFEYCRVKCFTPIEDYSLIPVLIEDGFMSTDQETRKALLEYKGNPLYDSECQSIMGDYFKLGNEARNWVTSGNPEDYPHADFIVTAWHIGNGVCGFADLSDLAED